jgi:hypothetical protein
VHSATTTERMMVSFDFLRFIAVSMLFTTGNRLPTRSGASCILWKAKTFETRKRMPDLSGLYLG